MATAARTIKVEIHRQSTPDTAPITEKFEIPYRLIRTSLRGMAMPAPLKQIR